MKKGFIILLVLAVLLAAGAFYGWKEYHRQHQDTATMEAAYTLSAPGLVKAFQDDENKANRQYNDKVLNVRGTILRLEQNDSTQTVQLDGQSMGGVICQFESSHSGDLKQLHPGQSVSIRGICTGMLMDVVLVRCALDDTHH
ncbi:MAG: hypothetical protein JST39_03560 [Bacteroidetes bacterium]|nr:hypothetical protein [Bacteroidota bacterium]